MRAMRLLAVLAVANVGGISQAWAIAGGGFAPGGPMSGSMRPSCDGYNMDGTRNLSPGANRPGCVDTSARAIHRPGEHRLDP